MMLARVALFLLLCGAAHAQIGVPPAAQPVSSAFVGVADLIASPTACYWLGGCSAAISTPASNVALNIRNSVTAETCDVRITSKGDLGVLTGCSGSSTGLPPIVFCALSAGHCTSPKLYDEMKGNACAAASCDLIGPGTTTDQGTIVFNCVNGKPCLQTTSVSSSYASVGSFTSSSSPASLVIVANRSAGTGATTGLRIDGGNNRIGMSTANLWLLGGGAGATMTAAAADAAWHVGIGVINVASTVLNIDGAETAGNLSKSVQAGAVAFPVFATTATLQVVGGVFWDTTAATPTQRTNLCQNLAAANGISHVC